MSLNFSLFELPLSIRLALLLFETLFFYSKLDFFIRMDSALFQNQKKFSNRFLLFESILFELHYSNVYLTLKSNVAVSKAVQ